MSDSLFLDKIGLYGDKVKDGDIPAAGFKGFSYTQKEFEQLITEDLVPILKVETREKLKIQNGRISIGNSIGHLDHMYISDLILFLQREGCLLHLLEGYEEFKYLPAWFLQDMCNVEVCNIKAEESPLNFKKRLTVNTTVLDVLDPLLKSIKIFDLKLNRQINSTVEGDYIYYIPTNSTNLIIERLSHSFYLCANGNSKVFRDSKNISKILSQGEVN